MALSEKLLPETQIIEWHDKPSVMSRMQESAYDTLDSFGIADDAITELSEKIMALLNRENLL